MKSRVVLTSLVLSVVLSVIAPPGASAIPVFARKYGFNCTMCHSNMPRLNDFGQRYRMNGYQLPGLVNIEKTVLESPAPVALRTAAGYTGTTFSKTARLFNQPAGSDAPAPSNGSDFRVNSLDLLSAGQLGRNIGYLLVYVPPMAEARGVAGQQGSLEMASIAFSNLGSSWFNVRVGRFEPAYVPFSVKRRLSVAPYAAYDATFAGGPAFSATQSGLEVTGHGLPRFEYAVGLIDGGQTNRPIDSPSDVYVRLATIIGAGEGQTAGHRVGLVGYLGRARPSGADVAPLRQTFYRAGLDASLNLGPANLALQYLMAKDNKAFWSHDKDVSYSGGFAELSWLPRIDLVGFARADYLDAPQVDNRDILRLTAGARCYFVDNAALHVEYSYNREKSLDAKIDDATSSVVTALVDFAF
jgi:hypothetical protein